MGNKYVLTIQLAYVDGLIKQKELEILYQKVIDRFRYDISNIHLIFQQMFAFYGSHFPEKMVSIHEKALEYPHLDIETTFQSYNDHLESEVSEQMETKYFERLNQTLEMSQMI